LNKKTWELLPFWFPQSKNSIFWALIFIALFGLSIDVWNWDSDNRIADWIPVWIIYLISIQLALAYFLWKFSKVWDINE
tara:strand:+ start:141 stop:377 length:237 start_codon:yes stop_codon:yes gene_type:complete